MNSVSILLLTYSIANSHCRCPTGLEVEAAGDAVDVEDLAREIKTWEMFALKGVLVNG